MSASHSDQLMPGTRLRKAREARGLSHEDVAARLHMSVTYVKAIDADDYERLPETAFVKGYMRNYARLVGVPADEVANLFQQMVDEERAHGGADEPAPSMAQQPTGKIRHVMVVAAIVLVLVLGWWLSLPGPSSDTSSIVVDAPETAEFTAPAPADDLAVEVTPPASETAAGTAATDSPATPVEPPAELHSFDDLIITFSADCWLEVLDASGEVVFSGQRNPERPLEMQGLGPFRITFGDGSAVASLSVNGDSVTIPSVAPGNVVRVSAP